jgi:hypothetical protein
MSKKFFTQCSESFHLLVCQDISRLTIIMQLLTQAVNTRHIPNTVSLLQEYCPSVLKTTCFNEYNIPFRREVKATEIGHLFEHILLEQLCIEKLEMGCRSAEYSGRTYWNWVKEPRGLFKIYIDATFSDHQYITHALDRTVHITEKVLSNLPVRMRIVSLPVQTNAARLSRYLTT